MILKNGILLCFMLGYNAICACNLMIAHNGYVNKH